MRSTRILVVENQTEIGQNTAQILTELGYAVCGTAGTGAAALEKCRTLFPDLILMEIMLDGIEAAREIQLLYDIPVVYLTTRADDETVQRAKNAAAYGFVIKPVQERALYATIEMALHRHRLEHPLDQKDTPAGPQIKHDSAHPRQNENTSPKLSSAIEQSSSTVVITDIEGHVEYVNPKFTTITGYSAEEIIGKKQNLLRSGFQTAEFYQQLWQTIRAGTDWQGEFCNLRKNGEQYWELASVSPVRNDAGDITHFVKIATEITDRVQAKVSLQHQNRQLAALNQAGQALAGTLELDQVLQRLIEVALEIADAEGCSVWLRDDERPDELICRACTSSQQLPPAGEVRISLEQGIVGWVTKTGHAAVVDDAQSDPRFFRGVDQASGFHTHSLLAAPLRLRDRILGVLEVVNKQSGAFQITDRVLIETLAASAAIALENARLYDAVQQHSQTLEEQVQIRTAELAQLIAVSPDAITVSDREGVLTQANRAAAELLGYHAPSELIGRPLDLYVPDNPESNSAQMFASVVDGETIKDARVTLTHLDGHHIPVSTSLARLTDASGRVRGTVAISRDISQQEAAARELQHYTERLRTLNELDRAILTAQSPDAIADAALEHLQRLVACNRSLVAVVDSHDKSATIISLRSDEELSYWANDQVRLPLSDERFARLTAGDPHIVADLHIGGALSSIEETLKATGERSYATVPLRVGQETVGLLSVGARRPDAFNADHVAIMQEVAGPLALAIHQARMNEQARQHAFELERSLAAERREREWADALRRIVELLNASLEVDEILQALVDASAQALAADACSILLYDPLNDSLVFRASTDIPPEKIAAGIRVPLDKSIAGRTLRERQPQMILDVESDPDYYTKVALSTGLPARSLLSVPLIRDDIPQGVVQALYTRRRPLNREQIGMLVAIANSTAAALNNARLYKTTQEMLAIRTAELDTIRQVAAALNRTPSLDAILQTGLNAMIDASAADGGSVHLAEAQGTGDALVCKTNINLPSPMLAALGNLPLASIPQAVKSSWQTSQSLFLDDSAAIENDNPMFIAIREAGFRSALLMTLHIHQRWIGHMALFSYLPHAFSATDETFLHCIADLTALAIENTQLLGQARQDAEIRATLLHEVNHRVKNNLLSIMGIVSLEMERPFRAAADFHNSLQDLSSRIEGLATVHGLLSDTEWTSLAAEKLISAVIHAALSGSPIRSMIEVKISQTRSSTQNDHQPPRPLLIPPKQATGLALVLNELTTNSIKHAFQGRNTGLIEVRITTNCSDRQVTIYYHDNGPGWPKDVLAGKGESVGLRLIKMTVKSPLRGRLELHNESGAHATLTFPLPPP